MKIKAGTTILVFFLILIVAFLYPRSDSETVLLSFDTEPVDAEDTWQILSVLERNDVVGTFFVTGEYAEQYPDIVKSMAEEHEVACHSYSHPYMSKISKSEKEEEIEKCISALHDVIGSRPVGFRAPYHDLDSETVTVLKENDFLYDASTIENFGVFFPDVNMIEVKISSYGFFPMSDVILTHYLKMPRPVYEFFMKRIKKEKVSLSFHPQHAVNVLDEIEGVIQYYKSEGAEFMTHEDYVEKG